MSKRTLAAAGMAALALAGCSSSGQEELQQWMTEQRAVTKPKVQPIPEPKKFLPQAYSKDGATDPFSNQKLTQALKRDSETSAATAQLLAPELLRRQEGKAEPLENFPLDSMKMVGYLLKEGRPVALVRIDKLLYQVRPGNYLGQNYGKIMKVGETEVVLREIVQDAMGEWTERSATLQLQEGSK
jgi:type IV pilus assembly protein PilP